MKIGFVEGAGNSNSPFIDDQTFEVYSSLAAGNLEGFSYRLKQIDTDGKFTYSDEVEVSIKFIPTEFTLEQNYPNPFNPTTKIGWQSPVSSWQTLKVYNILGNEVATLVDEEKEAGYYEIVFNAADFSSGIYFYRIQSGEFIATKKLVLLK